MRLKTILLCFLALIGLFYPLGLGKNLILGARGASTPFDYLVTILMENSGYCNVMTTCGGTARYMTSLAQNYSIAGTCSSDSTCSVGGYTAISHPSEPNYIALAAGDTLRISSDGNCCFQLSQKNIIDLIESSGRTWVAFAEDATANGTCSFHPPRHADHFPFQEFKDMETSSRCSHFITTSSPRDPEFINYLNSANPANFIWLTPTDHDNGHDSGVSGADTYLSSLAPKILSSRLFSTRNAALFFVYDEGPDSYKFPTDFLYASWSGRYVKTHYVGTGSYSHYSWSKTIETAWGLTSCMVNDCNANPMSEFFTTSSSGGASGLLGLAWSTWTAIGAVATALVASAIMLRARRKKSR